MEKSDETGMNTHHDGAVSWNQIKHSMELDGEPSKLRQYYEQWARTYDSDVESEGTTVPNLSPTS